MPVAHDPAGRRLQPAHGWRVRLRLRTSERPVRGAVRVWNGYVYFASRNHFPESERASADERYTEARRAAIPLADAYWQRAVAELREIYDWVTARPVETATADDLADDLGRGVGTDRPGLGHPLLRHPRAVPGPRRPGRPVRVGRARRRPGRGARADRRERSMSSTRSSAASSASRRWRRESIAVERLVRQPRGHARRAGGARRGGRLRRGAPGVPRRARPSRARCTTTSGFASWVEEPDLLLTEIAKRIEHSMPVDAETRRRHLAAQAEVLAERARAALAGDPERLARFERAARPCPSDRTADRGPQLLDRPAGAVVAPPVRDARRPSPGGAPV